MRAAVVELGVGHNRLDHAARLVHLASAVGSDALDAIEQRDGHVHALGGRKGEVGVEQLLGARAEHLQRTHHAVGRRGVLGADRLEHRRKDTLAPLDDEWAAVDAQHDAAHRAHRLAAQPPAAREGGGLAAAACDEHIADAGVLDARAKLLDGSAVRRQVAVVQ